MKLKILESLGKALLYTLAILLFISITVFMFLISFKLALLVFSGEVAFLIGLVGILFFFIFISVLLED